LDKSPADFDAEKNGFLVDDRLAAPYNEKGSLSWPLIGDKEEGMMKPYISGAKPVICVSP
jgi:hypothetical protein